jgi:hypothetical protein
MPEALQITTPTPGPLAENCTDAPGFTCGELGDTVSGERGATTVTVALEDLLGAATEVAVMVTFGVAGAVAGAVYKPDVEIDPHADPAHPVPATVHCTEVFVAPVTVAENCCCRPTLT